MNTHWAIIQIVKTTPVHKPFICIYLTCIANSNNSGKVQPSNLFKKDLNNCRIFYQSKYTRSRINSTCGCCLVAFNRLIN